MVRLHGCQWWMDEAVQPVIKMTVENSFIHLPFDILVVPYCSMRVSDQRVDMAPKSRIGKAKIAGTMSITVTAPPSAKSQFARGHRYRQWEGSPRHDLIVQLLLRFGRLKYQKRQLNLASSSMATCRLPLRAMEPLKAKSTATRLKRKAERVGS
ncbi:hypothetical protein GE21DRAFT_8704 [Neurospora crassa]|uniref:Uncharacterized protein n=1 Tax=Neurospora crassa (strain ATCC 24698 / 74-OR23-1A / CBS 708.71 / DSM 1257 / FGSC 987) TaxID=367110 RepID=V5ILW8_NEUCR|nr:hypothetical protein NCU17069 [Neurospora crassa OR74A]ESA42124.1 hypothetical protein NCU17069 [Neurospora crassa OR74A]KHE83316.1 hypothetical protein GE21DRAFT_8704 [Neurospora crassa]|eukprot:XP_011395080.1 hypothetical protein NCU17069 [Neurospora crassa OR74A]